MFQLKIRNKLPLKKQFKFAFNLRRRTENGCLHIPLI